jgi:Rod binding domain-containing protein
MELQNISDQRFLNNSNLKINNVEQEKEKAKQVAKDFEALFTAMMFRNMRKAMLNDEENEFIPKTTGEKIFTDLLDEEYGKISASQSSLGLAELILEQIEKQGSNSLDMLKNLKNVPWMFEKEFIPSKMFFDNETVIGNVLRWKDIIEQASRQYDVDKNLIAAVIACESSGNQYAVSPKGAKGLMQLIDTTAQEVGVRNVFNPQENIFGGTKYLKMLLEKFNGDEELALASYNAGPSAVEKFKGIPPYEETRQYVENVLATKNRISQSTIKTKGNAINE